MQLQHLTTLPPFESRATLHMSDYAGRREIQVELTGRETPNCNPSPKPFLTFLDVHKTSFVVFPSPVIGSHCVKVRSHPVN